MIIFIQVIWETIKTVAMAIFNPLFWLVVVLIWLQYKNKVKLEREILGKEQETMKDLLLDSIVYGLFAAIIGSIIIVLLGITIENIGLEYVWPLAILLMLINPRYICFSYAGGLVSLFSLIFGFPHINVPALMAIVGILHLMESMLIFLDGHHNSTPVFVELNDGRIVGGFSMQKFWPIPFAVLIIVTGVTASQGFNMPDWWPIIKPTGIDTNNMILGITLGMAALGYGDIAITKTPKKKSLVSAKRLLIFSLILIGLSIAGIYSVIFQFLAAIFAPLAHETIILFGQRDERINAPLFVAPENGVMVLFIAKGSPAEKMGISPGDTILKINDFTIKDDNDIINILSKQPDFLSITVRELGGSYTNYEYRDSRGIKGIGVLIVPKSPQIVMKISDGSLIGDKIKKFFINLFKGKR
ncbi:MAG: PDZ domain-containing protein [Thermoanaerobacteraceae bacterium]